MTKNGYFELIACFLLLTSICCADTCSVIDYTGKEVNLTLPVNKIISLSNMATEIICALDGSDRLIGRANSTFPKSIENVEIVGENSRSPDLERIVELDPDLLIADGMLSDEYRKEIEDAGIPVIIEKFTDPSRALNVTESIGRIMGQENKASEIIAFVKKYEEIIDKRIATVNAENEPAVFVEWNSPYRAASSGSGYNKYIERAGGSNIVKNASVQYPTVDSEWLIQQDPSVIIKLLSSTQEYTEEDMKKAHDEISGRPELSSIKAVKDGRIYVISGIIVGGLRSVIGELYLAKWFNPELFKDIDPQAVHKEMLQDYFGQELSSSYAYPSSS